MAVNIQYHNAFVSTAAQIGTGQLSGQTEYWYFLLLLFKFKDSVEKNYSYGMECWPLKYHDLLLDEVSKMEL